MRVLFVIPGEDVGSTMIFARRQAASLEEAGVTVCRFFLGSRTSPRYLAAEGKRFRAEVRKVVPDIVHAQYGTITSLFSGLGSHHPLVVTFRGSDINPCSSVSVVRSLGGRLLSQLSVFRANRVICVSVQVQKRMWWGRAKSVVIPSGVNLHEFVPVPQADARRRLGWGREEQVVIFNAGQSSRLKRMDLALAGLEAARTELPQLRMCVLNGDVMPEMVPLYLNAADVLLLTSDYEGSPNIVKEALACNLPVVTVDAGDVKERLAGVSPGCIVRRDPAAIGRALVETLQSGQRSDGRKHVQGLALPQVTRRLIEVYSEVLRTRAMGN